jgi:hypothetical protein
MENDPQVRRCLELGSTLDQCVGSSLKDIGKMAEDAASKFTGIDPHMNATRPLNGVVLVGSYRSRTNLPEVVLTSDGKAVLHKCGTLVDATHTYTLRKSRATVQVVIDNEPASIELTVRPDGSISGPGATAVKGSIVSAYTNQRSCQTGTTNVNCHDNAVPTYAPSLQRCMLGQLAPQPPPAPQSQPGGLLGMLGTLDPGAPAAATYGFRLLGTYAGSTGMKLEFSNGFVTLDCGKAHVNAPYTVDNTPGGFIVQVRNAGGPFQLAVAPDNTLRGSGSTTVNGKLVSAVRDGQVSFAPHSESCAIATFAPASPRNTMRASGTVVPERVQ